ncbi:hypothetical protein ALC56_14801 [Trachymyrmex septentrionalis]|uniref:Secreted protein n=1 Tax=Trachymyrmex septentrionalis TaxID=34720 RepID=A0A195ESX9_9HYME|nr:hypothetical protein ALC56_14801 [Trachymyrmex septentrionalis]
MTPSTTISLLWLFTVAIRAIPFPSWYLQECDTHKPASGEGSEPGLGFRARWRRRGERDVRIIDMRKTRFLDSASL